MAIEKIVRRLRWHAGLERDVDHETTSSLADCAGSATDRRDRLSDSTNDFVAALADLNRELNGAVPSEHRGPAPDIPRDAAYAVVEVVRMLRAAAESSPAAQQRQELLDAVWALDTAWNAVLAGDIDDLHEHVADERALRG
jgi:hypothetical protein